MCESSSAKGLQSRIVTSLPLCQARGWLRTPCCAAGHANFEESTEAVGARGRCWGAQALWGLGPARVPAWRRAWGHAAAAATASGSHSRPTSGPLHHTQVKRYICKECGKPCRSDTERDVHTRRTGHTEFDDKASQAVSTPKLSAWWPQAAGLTREAWHIALVPGVGWQLQAKLLQPAEGSSAAAQASEAERQCASRPLRSYCATALPHGLPLQTNEAEAIDTEAQMKAAQDELMDVDRPAGAGEGAGASGSGSQEPQKMVRLLVKLLQLACWEGWGSWRAELPYFVASSCTTAAQQLHKAAGCERWNAAALHGRAVLPVRATEPAAHGGRCAQLPPEVSAELLKQLEEMGFPPNRCEAWQRRRGIQS